MTKCLPASSDLTRNFIQEHIAADVDLTEELDATAVVLMVVQLIVTAVGFACYRSRPGRDASGTLAPRNGLGATIVTKFVGPTDPLNFHG